MKKISNKLRFIAKSFIVVLFLLIGINACYYFCFDLINKINSNCSEKIILHFIHGAITHKECFDQSKRIGGLLGGHVEVQIDSFIYGFEYRKKKDIHILPKFQKGKFNSKFTKIDLQTWRIKNIHEKKTSIEIPINQHQKTSISNICNSYHCNEPYDYAFFGYRCTSSIADILEKSEIIKSKNIFTQLILNFYPRQMRFRMVRWARKNNLKINLTKGANCKTWE